VKSHSPSCLSHSLHPPGQYYDSGARATKRDTTMRPLIADVVSFRKDGYLSTPIHSSLVSNWSWWPLRGSREPREGLQIQYSPFNVVSIGHGGRACMNASGHHDASTLGRRVLLAKPVRQKISNPTFYYYTRTRRIYISLVTLVTGAIVYLLLVSLLPYLLPPSTSCKLFLPRTGIQTHTSWKDTEWLNRPSDYNSHVFHTVPT